MLKKRYNLEAPLGINQLAFESFISKIVLPIRLNICRIITLWFEHHPRVFMDPQLLGSMNHFISYSVTRDIPAMGTFLLNTLERFLKESDKDRLDIDYYQLDPIIGEKIRNALENRQKFLNEIPNHIKLDVEIFEIDPTTAGRQLTLLELHLFQQITVDTIIDQLRNQNQSNDFITHSNDLTTWIACCILSSSDIKVRASYIKYFIQLGSVYFCSFT